MYTSLPTDWSQMASYNIEYARPSLLHHYYNKEDEKEEGEDKNHGHITG